MALNALYESIPPRALNGAPNWSEFLSILPDGLRIDWKEWELTLTLGAFLETKHISDYGTQSAKAMFGANTVASGVYPGVVKSFDLYTSFGTLEQRVVLWRLPNMRSNECLLSAFYHDSNSDKWIDLTNWKAPYITSGRREDAVVLQIETYLDKHKMHCVTRCARRSRQSLFTKLLSVFTVAYVEADNPVWVRVPSTNPIRTSYSTALTRRMPCLRNMRDGNWWEVNGDPNELPPRYKPMVYKLPRKSYFMCGSSYLRGAKVQRYQNQYLATITYINHRDQKVVVYATSNTWRKEDWVFASTDTSKDAASVRKKIQRQLRLLIPKRYRAQPTTTIAITTIPLTRDVLLRKT